MNFESQTTQKSKVPGYENVSFTVNKMTEGVRIQIRLKLAEVLARLRDIEAEREEFFDELAQAKGKPFEQITMGELTPRERRVLDGFNDRIELVNESEVNPAYFDAGFVGIDGLEINGAEPDAETLRKFGPPKVYREILSFVLAGGGLTAEEKENLESPTTSGAAVGGQTSGTDAPPVSEPGTTSPLPVGTAESTSPNS